MKTGEEIYVIFHQMPGKESRPQEVGVPADPLFCWVTGVYFREENIKYSVVASKYEDLFGIAPISQQNHLGPFHSSDELKRFFYLLSQELNASRVRFISLVKFDEYILKSNTKKELWTNLENGWDDLDNADQTPESNLLEKIFNRK